MEQLRIVVAGNTDCGRKTVIGRLISQPSNKTNQPQTVDYKKESAVAVEQLTKDDITDIPQFNLRTPEKSYYFFIPKDYTEFLKNAPGGTIKADAAILIIDASEGIHKQTCRYAYLFSMISVKQTVVVINEMGMKRYNRIKFWQLSEEISDFLKKLDMQIVGIIPVSAKYDDNITTASNKMDWNTSSTLMKLLDHFPDLKNLTWLPLRVIVQSCYLTDGRTKIFAKVASGKLFHGHQLTFGPVQHTARVLSIEGILGQEKTFAERGKLVALILEDTDYVSRG